MALYQDVVKFRDSQYNPNVYETNSVSSAETPGECTYEVSDSNNDVSYSSTMSAYPGNNSPVSEGYYSDFDTSSDSLKFKDTKGKEGKLGKNEQAFRKKHKISGQERMLYTSTITEDFKPDKNSLPIQKGDTVEVIRITDCPAGKWLVRDAQGNHGFVPLGSLQVSSDIQSFSTQSIFHYPVGQDLYTDIDARPYNSGGNADTPRSSDGSSVKSDDQYDDVSNVSQALNSSGGKGKVFGHFFKKDKSKKDDTGSASMIPNLDRTLSQEGEESPIYVQSDEQEREKELKSTGWKFLFNKKQEQKGSERKFFSPASGVKKFAKEEKTFRDKFKYEGEIKVLNIATINELAPLSPKNKLELAVKPGETVEIIDITKEDQIICRNFSGKYGYVSIDCLHFNIEHIN
ncbi:FYN-binding protein 2 isoform X2 [Dendropsophus ebraccatus]|uniref:FYN-binding protein 2 isoform X2 n=1 Tax=Dendropsophus ebraccatus TaxID=150705 RepID=UPI003831ABFF